MGVVSNLVPNAVNAQTTPDEEVTIIGGTTSEEFKYDKKEIRVEKNSWVNITLQVVSIMPHDFVIEDFEKEGFEGDDRTAQLTKDGGVNSDGIAFVFFKTPDKDVSVYFYCSVTGHRAQGMEGKLIVGEGSALDGDGGDNSTPGFEFFVGLLSLFALAGVVSRFRRQ